METKIIRGQKLFWTSNPTDGLWDIEVGYIIKEDIYIIKLTSTLRGKKYKYYKVNELYTREAEIIHQLREFGYMDKGMYAKVIDYIEYLRVEDKQIVELNEALEQYLKNERLEDEANRVYRVVCEYVSEHIEKFPSRKSNQYSDVSYGAVLDDADNIQKYGDKTFVIHKQYLDRVLIDEAGIIGKGRHHVIFEEWRRQGVLFSTRTGKEKRYQRKDLTLRDGMTGKNRKDGYVLRWDNADEEI